MALQETLPELAIIDEATVAAESAIISGLQSVFSLVADKVQSEQESLQSMLNSFGFGPMFAVI